jgi:large subunit ribosomal protein L7/L12
MASKHEHLIEEIGKMSVMDLAQFVKDLQERFGVTAMAAVAAPAAGDAAAPAASEKNEFKVTLKEAGAETIKVIKALRTVTTLSLGDAKKAVESAPFVVAESAPKEDAQKIKKALEEAGAKVELS